MSGDLKPADFGGDQGVFVGLGSGQGAGRIQLHQVIIIIEHTFNIRLEADTSPAKRHPATDRQHLANWDNTRRSSDLTAHWRVPGLHTASVRLPVEGELPSFGGATG